MQNVKSNIPNCISFYYFSAISLYNIIYQRMGILRNQAARQAPVFGIQRVWYRRYSDSSKIGNDLKPEL